MTATSHVTIDEPLDGLEFHWGRLSTVAAGFAAWDELEQLDFVMQRPIQEDDLELLTELIANSVPTAEQRRRFDNLLLPTAPVVPIGAGSDSTVAAIEHNLDVIKSADWLIDLGPQGGDRSGILADGTPEDVARVPESSTGQLLTATLTVAGPCPRRTA